MKTTAILIFLLANLSSVFGQTNESQIFINPKTDGAYDLPPGVVLPSKYEIEKDFTPQLNKLQNIQLVQIQFNHDFLSFWDDEEITNIKSNEKEYYSFMLRVKEYYDQLSDSVKTVFSVSDIWHVFIFDKELKNQLLLID